MFAGEAADMDRVGDREARPLAGRVHDQSEVAVQAALDGQPRRGGRARARRRRLAQVQDVRRQRQVRPGEERAHLEHQIIPRTIKIVLHYSFLIN